MGCLACHLFARSPEQPAPWRQTSLDHQGDLMLAQRGSLARNLLVMSRVRAHSCLVKNPMELEVNFRMPDGFHHEFMLFNGRGEIVAVQEFAAPNKSMTWWSGKEMDCMFDMFDHLDWLQEVDAVARALAGADQ